MQTAVTIVMYHYVRDFSKTQFPRINGLETSFFISQLEYIQKHYTVITAEELMDWAAKKIELPHNPLLLTFDDGFSDHIENVAPILRKAGIQGSFFPPVKAVLENQLLDVHKIHFLIAKEPDLNLIIQDIFQALDKSRADYGFLSNDSYYKKCAVANRMDSTEVCFIKGMLQSELPREFRKKLTSQLFSKYVSRDETSFAKELYMSINDLHEMVDMGMYVGSHSYSHDRLDLLNENEQIFEIERSLDFLDLIGANTKSWIMCYPYGHWNNALLNVLKNRGCSVGITTEVELVKSGMDPLLFPRIDTNDLPKSKIEPINKWTLKAQTSG